MNSYEGICCPEHLVNQKVDPTLQCMICYQVMTQPVMLQCGFDHTFGLSCINEWFSKGKKQCPMCRKSVSKYAVNNSLKQKIPQYIAICYFCKKWEGKLSKVSKHQQFCQEYEKSINYELEEVVKSQKQILDQQINPHLSKEHNQIFQKYVQNWFWLYEDVRDWKWWWWAKNKWWNQSCKQCNVLWHKYEKKIDSLEQKRIYFIQKIKDQFSLEKIRCLFDEK